MKGDCENARTVGVIKQQSHQLFEPGCAHLLSKRGRQLRRWHLRGLAWCGRRQPHLGCSGTLGLICKALAFLQCLKLAPLTALRLLPDLRRPANIGKRIWPYTPGADHEGTGESEVASERRNRAMVSLTQRRPWSRSLAQGAGASRTWGTAARTILAEVIQFAASCPEGGWKGFVAARPQSCGTPSSPQNGRPT